MTSAPPGTGPDTERPRPCSSLPRQGARGRGPPPDNLSPHGPRRWGADGGRVPIPPVNVAAGHGPRPSQGPSPALCAEPRRAGLLTRIASWTTCHRWGDTVAPVGGQQDLPDGGQRWLPTDGHVPTLRGRPGGEMATRGPPSTGTSGMLLRRVGAARSGTVGTGRPRVLNRRCALHRVTEAWESDRRGSGSLARTLPP
jgi:hypothetical protein